MKNMRISVIVLLLISTVGLAQQKEAAKSVALFTIAKNPVSTDEFIYLYKKNHNQPADFTVAKEDEYLNLLINFKLKIAEAHNRGLDTTASFKKEYGTYKEELKKPYFAGADDLDRLTKEAYEHLKEEIKASHILIAVKLDAFPADTLTAYNKIVAVRQRALANEDFEKLAREFSEDPSVKSNGGSLGYFTALQMVYPFEEAAYATPEGGISPIVRTRFGYHVLKVIDRMPARGEVEVSHILLRTGKGDDEKVKNNIFGIYDQLKAGRPWDELCKEYSEDANTKSAGGKLRPFGVGALPSVPQFEQMAFALKNPGDISDPFQTNIGWHIIRLEKKVLLPSYKDTEPALKRRVSRDERLQISKSNTLLKRKDAVGFKENSESRQYALSLADSSLTKAKWKIPAKTGKENEELFSVQGVKIPVGDFLIYVSKNQSPTALSPAADMHALYEKFVEEKVADAEEQKLVKENPEYRMLLNEYKEGILLFEIMEKEVWNKASLDTVGQKKFYTDHLIKYAAGDRLEAKVFATADKTFLSEIKTKINKGDTITAADLKRFKSVQHKRSYEKGENKVIDKVSWVTGLQETEADGMYYLVDVSRLIAPGTKTFDEARASVISDYQDSLEKAWIIKLRQKYPVKINKSARKSVITQLNK